MLPDNTYLSIFADDSTIYLSDAELQFCKLILVKDVIKLNILASEVVKKLPQTVH
jgi:hypothetical protein